MHPAARIRPLRERHAVRTRGEILAAIGRLFTDESLDEVTFAEVARESGMSERTIYRYFPTKQALLDEFWTWLNLESGITRPPEDVPELLEAIPAAYAGFDRNAALVRAYIVSCAGRALHERGNTDRTRIIERCLSDATRGLDARDRRKVCAVVQLLFSARGWDSMTGIWKLTGEEAGGAARWAVQILLEGLKRDSGPETSTSGRTAKT